MRSDRNPRRAGCGRGSALEARLPPGPASPSSQPDDRPGLTQNDDQQEAENGQRPRRRGAVARNCVELMDVDVPRDVASVDDAGPFGISSWQDPGLDAQVNPASRSRSRTISGCSVQMSGNFLPFPEPGAPPHSMLGDDAALVQEGVAAHETRATGGSRASRRGAGSAGARTVGGACSSTTDCRSRAASTRCHCRPAPSAADLSAKSGTGNAQNCRRPGTGWRGEQFD